MKKFTLLSVSLDNKYETHESDDYDAIKSTINQLHPKTEVKLLFLINNKTSAGYVFKAEGGLMHILPVVLMFCGKDTQNFIDLREIRDLRHTMPKLHQPAAAMALHLN